MPFFNCPEVVVQRWSSKMVFLKISQNSQRNTCRPQPCNFIKKEALAQVLSREFCEIFKNTLFSKITLKDGCSSGKLFIRRCQQMILCKQSKRFHFSGVKQNFLLFNRDLSLISSFSPSVQEIHFQKQFFEANLPFIPPNYHNITSTKCRH